MHELITAKFDSVCSLSGEVIKKGEDIYYDYQTKTLIHPKYYENITSQINSNGMTSYFARHKKLNEINPKP